MKRFVEASCVVKLVSARRAIIGTLVASAALNSFAFAIQASNEWMMAPAVGLGIAVPGMVFCLTKVGALMWIDCHSRG